MISIKDRVLRLEKETQRKLPEDYINFLCRINSQPLKHREATLTSRIHGRNLKLSIEDFFSPSDDPDLDIESNYRYYLDAERIPADALPIAIDIGGDLICMSLHPDTAGEIYCWNHELELDNEITSVTNLTYICKNFAVFSDLLKV